MPGITDIQHKFQFHYHLVASKGRLRATNFNKLQSMSDRFFAIGSNFVKRSRCDRRSQNQKSGSQKCDLFSDRRLLLQNEVNYSKIAENLKLNLKSHRYLVRLKKIPTHNVRNKNP